MKELTEKLQIYKDLLDIATPLVEEADRTLEIARAAKLEHDSARASANRAMESVGEALSDLRQKEKEALEILLKPKSDNPEEEELLQAQRAEAEESLILVGRALKGNSLYQRHVGLDKEL